MPRSPAVSVFQLVVYRLWRCRRLLTLVPSLIVLAALFAGWMGGLSSYYFTLPEVALAGAIALLGTSLAVILLPAAPLEVLFGGMAVAILVATEPWQGMLFQPAAKGGAFTPLWLRGVIFATAGFVLMAILYALATWIAIFVPSRKALRYRVFVQGGDAAELRRALDLQPNSTSGPVTYGSTGWDGMVPAKVTVRGHDPQDFDIRDINFEFFVKSIGSTDHTDSFFLRTNAGEQEVHTAYRNTKAGAWVETEERPGPSGRLIRLSIQLNDSGADLIRSRVDDHLGRASPATILRTQRSVLGMFAWLTHVPGPKTQHPAE